MKTNVCALVAIALALSTSVVTAPAIAQSAAPMGSPSAGTHQSAQAYFDRYMAQAAVGAGALDDVMRAAAAGLPANSRNCALIRQALSARPDPNTQVAGDNRAALLRLLAQQHTPQNPTGMNHLILQDLKVMAKSADVQTARDATFAFSRLGYVDGWDDVLQSARNRKVIDSTAYFGEVAHVLPFAPASEHLRLANLLRESGELYASQIVAMLLNTPTVVNKFSPEVNSVFMALLDSTEPRFSTTISQFDYVEATRYANWLHALASLKASDFNAQGTGVVMQRLNDPTVDPRKIMAYLVSEYGAELMKAVGQRSRFDLMLQRVSLYARQNPMNSELRAIATEIAATLARFTT